MRRPILLSINQQLDTKAADDARRAAVVAGFDGVEGLLPDPACPLDATATRAIPLAPAADETKAKEVAAEGNTSAVTVARANCVAHEPEEAIAEVIELLYRAADVGASCLCLTLPPLRPAANGVPPFRYQDALTLAYKILRGARFDAEAVGVPLALEATTGGCLLSPVELRELIDAAASWAVGACVDAARLGNAGALDDWLTTLTHRAHAIRIPASSLIARTDSSAASKDERVFKPEALAAVPTERPVIVSGVPDGGVGGLDLGMIG